MGIMSKEHLNDCSLSFTQLPVCQQPCLDQAAEGSSVFSLCVAFVCKCPLEYVCIVFMLRVGKKQHSPSLSL